MLIFFYFLTFYLAFHLDSEGTVQPISRDLYVLSVFLTNRFTIFSMLKGGKEIYIRIKNIIETWEWTLDHLATT